MVTCPLDSHIVNYLQHMAFLPTFTEKKLQTIITQLLLTKNKAAEWRFRAETFRDVSKFTFDDVQILDDIKGHKMFECYTCVYSAC